MLFKICYGGISHINTNAEKAEMEYTTEKATINGTERRVHYFESTGDAYDWCMGGGIGGGYEDDDIHSGDTIVIKSEGVVGVSDAWPQAVTKHFGDLHMFMDEGSENSDGYYDYCLDAQTDEDLKQVLVKEGDWDVACQVFMNLKAADAEFRQYVEWVYPFCAEEPEAPIEIEESACDGWDQTSLFYHCADAAEYIIAKQGHLNPEGGTITDGTSKIGIGFGTSWEELQESVGWVR